MDGYEEQAHFHVDVVPVPLGNCTLGGRDSCFVWAYLLVATFHRRPSNYGPRRRFTSFRSQRRGLACPHTTVRDVAHLLRWRALAGRPHDAVAAKILRSPWPQTPPAMSTFDVIPVGLERSALAPLKTCGCGPSSSRTVALSENSFMPLS